MNVEKLIGELSEHRKLMWTVDMKPGVPRCHAVPLDLIVEAADALAKLQVDNSELRQEAVTQAICFDKVVRERDEAREALRPTDYNTLGQIGKAALDVCLPILKAHWAGGGSASMNPSLEYLDVSMGKAAMEAASRALGGGE